MSRLMLKGKLQELKEERRKVSFRAESLMESIKDALALSAVTSIKAIDTEKLTVWADELHKKRTEVIRLSEDIDKLEAELNG